MAAEPQGPAYDAAQEPLAPSGAPTQEMAPAAPEQPQAAIDLETEAAQAISAGLTLCKAFGTGKPEQIQPEAFKAIAEGVRALFEGLAKYAPPAPPLDPNVVQKDNTEAAKAALQDDQKDRELALQEKLGARREGRPSGPAKP